MIVLDTNIVSELTKPEAMRSERVFRWAEGYPPKALFMTSVTFAEILAGIALLPKGRRRDQVSNAVEAVLARFRGRVLPFDAGAAVHYADLFATRRRKGLSLPGFDLQIAAIARVAGMAVATRNVTDFQECGVDVVDPFAA